MKSITRIAFLVLLASTGLLTSGYSQEVKPWEREGEGEIKDVEIEIVKDRKIILPRENRNFQKVPPRPYEPIKPAITYDLKNLKFSTPDYKPSIRPLKVKDQELSKIYGNYVAAGLGNYSSYYVEGSITTKRDKSKFMGAHFYNRTFGSGPVDEDKSAASSTDIQVFGKSMGQAVTLSGEANYNNRGTYFYGYSQTLPAPERDAIRQTYTTFGLNVGLENTKPSDFNYLLKVGYSNLKDHYQATEDEVSLALSSSYKINDTGKFILDADYFLINRKDALINTDPRHLFKVRPAYQFVPVENLTLTLGANLALTNDQYTDSKDLHLYPHFNAQYQLGKSFEAYGTVTGDIDKVNLHTLSSENLWLGQNIPITNTNRSLEFRAGLKGKVGSKVSVNAGFSVAAMKNYYFYVPEEAIFGPPATGIQKFTLVYDGNTKRFNPFAEVSFAHAESAALSLRADYFAYGTDNLPDAYHRPSYRVQATSRFNIYEKIVFEAGIIAQGGMKSTINIATVPATTVDAAFDLHVKTRYFVSKQVSAFVQLDNMLSNKYPIYSAYPARGFQALVGASWSF